MFGEITQGNAPTLLFVEDDDDAAFLFCSELRKIAPHWNIAHTRDGRGAIERLENAPVPQGIVTDLRMPGMGGLDLVRWIKAQPHLRHIPLVICSSSDDPTERERCLSLKVSAYLEKQGAIKDLRSTIRSILKIFEKASFPTQELGQAA